MQVQKHVSLKTIRALILKLLEITLALIQIRNFHSHYLKLIINMLATNSKYIFNISIVL